MQQTLEERVKILEENLNKFLKINQGLLARVETLETKLAQFERAYNDEFIERKIERELTTSRRKNLTSINADVESAEENNFVLGGEKQSARKNFERSDEQGITHTRLKKTPATVENINSENEPAPPKSQPVYSRRTTVTVNDEYAEGDFVKDYNVVLSKTDGYEKQSARKKFIAKYNVKFFNCVNFNERMNNPKLNPVFEENSTVQGSDFWAIPISGNTFKVVPNVKNYNENCHVARAMGEVFDSNFKDGSYSNIQLAEAAEFINSGQNWTLIKKGKLVLR